MSDAFCHRGLTIEYDSSGTRPRLNIDGQPINVAREEGRYRAPNLATPDLPSLEHESLYELGKLVIDNYPEYQTRKRLRCEHLKELSKGVAAWNSWRSDHQEIRPLLYEADIRQIGKLTSPNFANANLIHADFRGMKLIKPNFHEANLGRAEFCGATLTRANFCRTDLYETDFSKATLIEANLQGTQLAKTIFRGATLKNCKIYGMSSWDLNLNEAKQKNHVIKYRYRMIGYNEGSKSTNVNGNVDNLQEITVDDLEVAQFIYLLLCNEKINNFIKTINTKAVLILGRFTPRERKEVLDALREGLRALKFVPIIFDFERPAGRTFTETVVALAGLSQFVIADITNPLSVLQELQATVPQLRVPFVPIIQANDSASSMFGDLYESDGKTGRMLPLLPYHSKESLVRALKPKIIEPAQRRAKQLAARKGMGPPMQDAV